MAEVRILAESIVDTYPAPDRRVRETMITYQAEGMAPRLIAVESDKLPDYTYRVANPGKPVPADVQAKGDTVRKQAIDADMAKLKQAPQPRRI